MTDDELMQEMEKIATENKPEVVLAEFELTSTELHKIGNGTCCVFNSDLNPFSIRFLLKSSFKSPKSNFVINKYALQVVITQKQKFMRKEDIAVRTKVVKTKSKKPEKMRVETEVKETATKLF